MDSFENGSVDKKVLYMKKATYQKISTVVSTRAELWEYFELVSHYIVDNFWFIGNNEFFRARSRKVLYMQEDHISEDIYTSLIMRVSQNTLITKQLWRLILAQKRLLRVIRFEMFIKKPVLFKNNYWFISSLLER